MDWKKFGSSVKEAVMTGIGYMIPLIIAGAMIMAVGNLLAAPANASQLGSGLAYTLYTWGSKLFNCMCYMLAMYTAFAIGNKGALVSGFVAGLMAIQTNTGFVGAVAGGLLAGWITVFLTKHMKVPKVMAQAKPLVIMPIVTSLIMFALMTYAIAPAATFIINILVGVLNWAKTVSPLFYGGILAALVSFGMGGPPGYASLALALVALQNGDYTPFSCMIIGGIGSCLGVAVATFVARSKFTPQERAGWISLITGFICLIPEMMIPYALRDPKRVFTAAFLGGFVGGALIMAFHVIIPAIHGGLLAIPLANNVLLAIVAILADAAVTCLFLVLTKKKLPPEESGIGMVDAA